MGVFQSKMRLTAVCLCLVIFISFVQGYGYLRIVHAIGNGPDVDVYVNGGKIADDMNYKQITTYENYPENVYTLVVRRSGSSEVLMTQDIRIKHREFYTAAIVGLLQDTTNYPLRLMIFEDDNEIRNNDAIFRFVHIAAGTPRVDFYLDGDRQWSDVGYGELGSPEFVRENDGKIWIEMRISSADLRVVGPVKIDFPRGSLNTIYALGVLGDYDSPLTVVIGVNDIELSSYEEEKSLSSKMSLCAVMFAFALALLI